MIVYLSGPILGCLDEEADDWRTRAASILFPHKCLNPRRREYDPLDLKASKEIVELDKLDIRRSDALLVNAWRASAGTSMELLYAWELEKIICTIIPYGDVISPWVYYHSTVVQPTLREGCEWLRECFEI